MNRYSRKIEEEIKKAIESGAFEDLPGKGKPLELQGDSGVADEWRLTHHLLRSNDFTLPWIHHRNEIEQQVGEVRAVLARVWAWRQGVQDQDNYAEREWQRALEAFHQEIDEINRSIRDYNLEAPSTRFHLMPLKADREIERIIGEGD